MRFARERVVIASSVLIVAALAFPAVASAAPLLLTAVPDTTAAGATFAVAGETEMPGPITVRAVTVAAPEVVVNAYATVASSPATRQPFSAVLSLPRGGDWLLYAVSGENESPPRRISCNPARVWVSCTIDRTKVAYDTPAIFSATVRDATGAGMPGAPLDLCAIDEFGTTYVVRHYATSASGAIRVRVNNGGRYFRTPYYNVYRNVRWVWRYPDSGNVGSVSSASATTTATFKLLRSQTPSATVSGKTKLSRSHRYEFFLHTPDQLEAAGRLALRTPRGRLVFDTGLTPAKLPTIHTPFSASSTGYYPWKVSGLGGHALTWGIW